jgi:hypothetical protein
VPAQPHAGNTAAHVAELLVWAEALPP